MAEPAEPRSPVAAAGVVCLRGAEVLLIRRGTAPRLGEWSVPGGRIEWGERAADAALRELKEETGVDATLLGIIDVVDGIFAPRGGGAPWGHYLLVDYAARWTGGEPTAGDDAAEARFFPIEAIDDLGLWDETVRVIHEAHARFGEQA
jgi:8-oxo-dGTP diphosphatase